MININYSYSYVQIKVIFANPKVVLIYFHQNNIIVWVFFKYIK